MLDDERSATNKVEEVRHQIETVLEEVDEYLASHDEKPLPQQEEE